MKTQKTVTFLRAQASSLVATAVDYGTLFTCVEIFKLWYVPATALGAALGAVTNFLLNRHWSFQVSHGVLHHQARRYALVSLGSLSLNTAGVYAVTEGFRAPYGVSKVIASLVVGVFFNFPLHRHYVFKET